MTSADMLQYYARRSGEYERIYQRPERQGDLRQLTAAIEAVFAGRRVLDIACGTGYFSAWAARRASSLVGLDANEETLALARAKNIPKARFEHADAYALPLPAVAYSGCLMSFWCSHVPRQHMAAFLAGVCKVLEPGAPVLIADNTYVEGSSTALARRDAAGNTYQERVLEDGGRYEVLKNFPTCAELLRWGLLHGSGVELRTLTYYWLLLFRSKSALDPETAP
ncbi:MAG: methyltransferase domain-containing protein [Burkholderiales bacterium]|nr:methyltransferase domain-containing protein [Burkholderiales bacterium]